MILKIHTQKGASMATAITDLRKLNRLSQSQLAEKAGLTQKTIGNYEKDISFIRNA
ncbi:helix-turn-helix transcriptional regulator, partial [Citrobacter sp. TBCS-15]|uniref:helix-turn-helix transcriptional regulator n=1 Tax=Citrobacter sp. TBCS-15 TaxID=2576407 RepID=UPI001BB072E0